MMSSYLAFGSILLQGLAGSGLVHVSVGILIVLGLLLFALGTVARRSMLLREDSTRSNRFQPRPQTVPAETNRMSVNTVRGEEAPSTSAHAA